MSMQRFSVIHTATVADGGLLVQVAGDTIIVMTTPEAEAVGVAPLIRATEVAGLAAFIARAGDLRISYGETVDFALVYVRDVADDGFGYCVNLDAPEFSEWGYSPAAA